MRYEQYAAMLEIDTYKRTHDRLLLLVMRFALDSMATNNLHVKKDDILRIYEARIGLEQQAIRLLDGQLSIEDAMRMLRTYGDTNLFVIFPAPQPKDKAYIAFLNQQAGAAKWPIHCRQDAYRLLFALDERTYRAPFREFLLSHADTATDWWERAKLYGALVQLKDEESLKAVRRGLVHDPITECREDILYDLRKEGEATSAIDAILVIADGHDEMHHAVTVSRMPGEWSYNLNEYLKWAKSHKGLDAITLRKVDEATEKLRNTDWD
jgi:hypothetical protein